MNEERARDTLFTGALSVSVPEDARRTIALIGGWSPARSAGTVRVDLQVGNQPPYIRNADGRLVILLPEPWARALGSTLQETSQRLAHLRTLHKLGRLSDAALYEHYPESGTIEDGNLMFGQGTDAGKPGEMVLLLDAQERLLAALKTKERTDDHFTGVILFKGYLDSLEVLVSDIEGATETRPSCRGLSVWVPGEERGLPVQVFRLLDERTVHLRFVSPVPDEAANST